MKVKRSLNHQWGTYNSLQSVENERLRNFLSQKPLPLTRQAQARQSPEHQELNTLNESDMQGPKSANWDKHTHTHI